jgi:hypothetical protein
MRQYRIFGHPSGLVETVKQGWSWPGFFFTWLWALIKGLWLIGLVAFVIQVATSYDPALSSLVSLIMMIVFGVNGNDWREKDLISKGYSVVGIQIADNSSAAISTYLLNKENS